MSAYIKGGAMVRHISHDRSTINDLRQANLEFQAGLSRNLSSTLSMSMGYQGVFSNGLKLQTLSVTNTGTIKNIPSQHGVFVSIHYMA